MGRGPGPDTFSEDGWPPYVEGCCEASWSAHADQAVPELRS